MRKCILIIGDDLDFFNDIRGCFVDGAVDCHRAESVKEALWKMELNIYCLILLNVAREDAGYNDKICALRNENPIPLLVLMEHASTSQKISILQNGADCVMEKPLANKMVAAQIKALLRRYTEWNHIMQNEKSIICCGKLLVDTGRRMVFINGKEIAMPNKEYGILLYMLKNRWRILTHEQIYEAVWKEQYLDDKSVIFYHMGELRRRLGEGWIENVHGIGYRMCSSKCTELEGNNKP